MANEPLRSTSFVSGRGFTGCGGTRTSQLCIRARLHGLRRNSNVAALYQGTASAVPPSHQKMSWALAPEGRGSRSCGAVKRQAPSAAQSETCLNGVFWNQRLRCIPHFLKSLWMSKLARCGKSYTANSGQYPVVVSGDLSEMGLSRDIPNLVRGGLSDALSRLGAFPRFAPESHTGIRFFFPISPVSP